MKIITIDFSKIKYLMEIHKLLQDTFKFPVYGNNWDALWDALNYWFNEPVHIRLVGLEQLPKGLHFSADRMLSVFEDLDREDKKISVTVEPFPDYATLWAKFGE